jgi:hypothetical protein
VELRGSQELADILHNENLRTRPVNDLHEGSPKLLSWVRIPVLVEKTEALAGWTTDDDISRRNTKTRMIKQVNDIPVRTMITEVGIVGPGCIFVEIVRPDRLEGRNTLDRPNRSEAECEPPGSREKIDEAIGMASHGEPP